MIHMLKRRNFYLMLMVDVVLLVGVHVSAYLLRFDMTIPAPFFESMLASLPSVILCKVVALFIFGLYRGMWRYTSYIDMWNLVKAATTSTAVIVVFILYAYHFRGYPRSVFVIDWFLTILSLGFVRFLIRLVLARNFPFFWQLALRKKPQTKRLLIVGAGNAGEKVVRELYETTNQKYSPIGLLDDDQSKLGKAIHGVPVLGMIAEMDNFRDDYDEILIAAPTCKGRRMREIAAMCEKTGKPFHTVPSMWELIAGNVSVKTIRDVTLEDFLDREEISINEDEIQSFLRGKRVLVTGAGGSIGAELVRHIERYHPASLVLVDFSEYNLFKIEMEFIQRNSGVAMTTILMDVKDRDALRMLFHRERPEVVFHAAAYKHVPLQELHPWEAVFNNVVGTANVVDAAKDTGAEKIVFVSTDKAVKPVSVMGATKRLAEMLVESLNGKTGVKSVSVRFGNVLGSSGSVIPLFQEQISRGGPVTVTHPDVERYFMSIPEAAQLILQAGAMGEGGEVFILDMGRRVKILDMVYDMIRLNGYEPEIDITVDFIGLRPGEKLYEELITEGENVLPTNHDKILVIRGNRFNRQEIFHNVEDLVNVSRSRDAEAIKRKLQEIIPEYRPYAPTA